MPQLQASRPATTRRVCAVCQQANRDQLGYATLVYTDGQYQHPACQPTFNPYHITGWQTQGVQGPIFTTETN